MFSKNHTLKNDLKYSKSGYDAIHQTDGFGEEEEGYKILGLLLRGKKSVDIGCGYGLVERYSPETVAVDFSKEALKVASSNGAKRVVQAYAEKLPFSDNEFDIALSLGVLEHCAGQELAVKEMTRVAEMQILVVHASLPFGLEKIRKPVLKLFALKDQPIEKPLTLKQMEFWLNKHGSKVMVRGIWNYIDLRWLWKKIPYGLVKWPSHHFVIAIKSPNLERKFLGEKELPKQKENLGQTMYNRIFYNKYVKKFGLKLLNSPLLVNNILYQTIQKQYIKNIIDRYKNKPNIVVIENTNLCNYQCALCPHSQLKRKMGVMNENLFKKIIDEASQLGVKKIAIHGFGEPAIDQNLSQRIAHAKSKGIKHVGTSSNGSLMTKELARKIILSGLDEINFSLDAYSQAAYAKMRSGKFYHQVMNNVERFISIRNKLKQTKPLVVVDFIKSKHNYQEVDKFYKKWLGLADHINITTPHSWGGAFKEEAGERSFHSRRTNIKREPCRFLWTDLVVNWDGRVSACCQDYEASLVVGDLNLNSIKEIWQSEKLENLREIHLNNKADAIPLCRRCDYRSLWWLFK